jgi:hypothetical protein
MDIYIFCFKTASMKTLTNYTSFPESYWSAEIVLTINFQKPVQELLGAFGNPFMTV